jgi:predicted negative regulator of RcsB-dependent stress response
VANDRNQNVKQQLLKKRDEAARRKVPLAPGEMVDDAIARGMSGAGRWLRANFGVLQWVIVAGVAGGIGYAVYDNRSIKRAEAASADLIKGTTSERGRVVAGSTAKGEEDSTDDPTPVFKSVDEKRETALASYRKVTAAHAGTGAAILARLGEAGVLLDKREWDPALTAYNDVKSSALATADVTVKGRAIEGAGLALEGKKDVDGALKAFRELDNTDARGLKELGMYHQARILYAKGENDKAKELLKGARERLKSGDSASKSSAGPGPGGEARPFAFLESQVDDLLKRIDPTAVVADSPSAAAGAPGGKGVTPENLKKLQEELQRKLQEKAKKPGDDKGGAGNSGPAGSP